MLAIDWQMVQSGNKKVQTGERHFLIPFIMKETRKTT